VKAAEIAATGLTLVASANPGCEMQLKTYLGTAYEVKHPIELYWQAIGV
jgi:Fe-S oxidoreductase